MKSCTNWTMSHVPLSQSSLKSYNLFAMLNWDTICTIHSFNGKKRIETPTD